MKEWRAGVGLLVEGVLGVTDVVESLHSRIGRGVRPFGQVEDRPARGISGLVYRSIRGTTRLVGWGLDMGLGALQSQLAGPSTAGAAAPDDRDGREALWSAFNGVVGDHLERSGSALAIALSLRERPAAEPESRPSGRVLLLVHGLCMNDRQWTRNGHDHGRELARCAGFTPVYARYNSGRHIGANGLDLALEIEALLAAWPVEVEQLVIVGHSMGGLVARSADHQARQAQMRWPKHLKKMVFLGSPHHGAPLERMGNWLHRVLELSPYAEPLSRLSGLRSESITDLRHGELLPVEAGAPKFDRRDQRSPVPLPPGVACFAIAGSLSPGPSGPKAGTRRAGIEGGDGRTEAPSSQAPSRLKTAARRLGGELLGDGLVPIESALGRHPERQLALGLPEAHQRVAWGVNHMDLLSDPGVAEALHEWLSA